MPICRECLVEPNCKHLRELFDTKRANRHHETLEKSLGIFAFLFINTQQSAAVSFGQCLWQVYTRFNLVQWLWAVDTRLL